MSDLTKDKLSKSDHMHIVYLAWLKLPLGLTKDRADQWRKEISDIIEQHFAPPDEALRRVVWLNHGCPMPALYGDDGEMQCNICRIDFKRMSGSDIERLLQKRGLKKMHERASAKPPDEAVEEALERFSWLDNIQIDKHSKKMLVGLKRTLIDEDILALQTIRQALTKLDCISPDKNTK